jgi:hypothetical protein
MPLVTPRIEVALGQTDYAFETTAFNALAFGGSSGWTDITPDVSLGPSDTVEWTRGMTDNAPTTRTAAVGTLTFWLRNDGGNSGHTQGWYSPNNPDVRDGWTFGIPVRLVVDYLGTTYYLWLGKLRTIDPDPGRYGTQRVRCLAQDCMGDLSDTDVRELPIQVNKTEHDLVEAVIAALPASAAPLALDNDAGLDTYVYAFDAIGSGAKAMAILNDIAISSLGYIYPTANGHLRYENRQQRTLKTPVYNLDETMDALVVPTDLSTVYNRVRATAHPKTVDSAATTLIYQARARVLVPPSGDVEIWGTYTDPTNRNSLIGGTAFVTPLVSGTDFTATANADGTGADLTASVTVTATPFASTVKFAIHNGAVTPAYVYVQLRGKGIYDYAPITMQGYSPEDYGDQPLSIDLPFQSDTSVAQDVADYLCATYKDQARQVSSVGLPCDTDELLMQALTREIGDIISASERVTGLQGTLLAIHGVHGSLTAGGQMHMTWNVTPHAASQVWLLDDAVYSILDSTTVFGF